MFVHAIRGCDTVSAPYMIGKQRALEVIRSYGDQDSLSTFTEPRCPPEDVKFPPTGFLGTFSMSFYIIFWTYSEKIHRVTNLF